MHVPIMTSELEMRVTTQGHKPKGKMHKIQGMRVSTTELHSNFSKSRKLGKMIELPVRPSCQLQIIEVDHISVKKVASLLHYEHNIVYSKQSFNTCNALNFEVVSAITKSIIL